MVILEYCGQGMGSLCCNICNAGDFRLLHSGSPVKFRWQLSVLSMDTLSVASISVSSKTYYSRKMRIQNISSRN